MVLATGDLLGPWAPAPVPPVPASTEAWAGAVGLQTAAICRCKNYEGRPRWMRGEIGGPVKLDRWILVWRLFVARDLDSP